MNKLVAANLLILFLFLSGCIMDFLTEIAIIKNKSNKDLLVIHLPDNMMNDSIFKNQYSIGDTVAQGNSLTLAWPNIKTESQPDSVKAFVFVYDLKIAEELMKDSANLEISNKAIIKRLTIQLNKIERPLDTIIVN